MTIIQFQTQCPADQSYELRDLLGCNIRVYPPEVNELCENPLFDNAFLAPDNKTVWIFKGNKMWHLVDLPTTPKGAPVKTQMSFAGNPSKTWNKFQPGADAFFLAEG